MYSYPNRFCEGTVIHFPNAEIIRLQKIRTSKTKTCFYGPLVVCLWSHAGPAQSVVRLNFSRNLGKSRHWMEWEIRSICKIAVFLMALRTVHKNRRQARSHTYTFYISFNWPPSFHWHAIDSRRNDDVFLCSCISGDHAKVLCRTVLHFIHKHNILTRGLTVSDALYRSCLFWSTSCNRCGQNRHK